VWPPLWAAKPAEEEVEAGSKAGAAPVGGDGGP